MALLLQSSPSSSLAAAAAAASKKTHHLHHLAKPHFYHPSKPSLFSIRSADPSSQDNTTTSSSSSSSTSLGFGSTSDARPVTTTKKKKQKGKRERASVIRRAPLERPKFASEKEEARAREQRQNENAFLLAWLGLGAIILVEGITLAASGFLPEEWDNFFAKYLYPSFTPTVFLFVAGTVAYGVFKYLQNEKFNSEK